MCHNSHLRQTKSACESCKIFAVLICGPVRHTVRTYLVRIVVSAAVSYCAITLSEFWKMLAPHAVVLEAAMNKYYRFALTDFYIGKLRAIGCHPLNFISHGHGACGSANY